MKTHSSVRSGRATPGLSPCRRPACRRAVALGLLIQASAFCPLAFGLDVYYHSATHIPVATDGYTATGETLQVSLGFEPPTGTNLTVIRMTGPAGMVGEFANLAHGDPLVLSYAGLDYHFLANYHGNHGRDLVLQWASVKPAAWGDGANGKLGDGAEEDRMAPVEVTSRGAFWGRTVFAGAAGGGHSLAACSDGTVVSWGVNTDGQLGINSTTGSFEPVAVDMPANRKVIAVAAGASHSLALDADGMVFAWGRNTNGQLGNNSTTQSNAPVAVSTAGVLSGRTVVAIAAGTSHSLALCSDGRVVAWGLNTYGQLGNNSTVQSDVPVLVSTTSGALAGKTVVAISAGADHSLALCSDGSVAAWGRNTNGQLGNNSTTQSTIPAAVTTGFGALQGKAVVVIAGGGSHSLALCTDGTVAAWGLNAAGQLGNGGNTQSTTPVAVTASGVLAGKSVFMVAAGAAHSIAHCRDGTVAAWGANSNGELGNNSTSASNTPVAVENHAWPHGPISACTTGATASHTLALLSAPPVDVAHAGILKILQYNQSSSGDPTPDPDGHFTFMSSVVGGPMGELLASSTLTPPVGATGTSMYEKGSDGLMLAYWPGTKAELDAAYPPGFYQMTLHTSVPNTYEVGLNLGADNYPGIPKITGATNAIWQDGVLKITDPALPVTLTWENPESDYSSFQIQNTSIFSGGGVIATQFTIPANSFAGDSMYRASITLIRNGTSVQIPGLPDSYVNGNYNVDVKFLIQVGEPMVDEPSLYLLLKSHIQAQTSGEGPADFPNTLPDSDLAPYSMSAESPVGGNLAGPAGTSFTLGVVVDTDGLMYEYLSSAFPSAAAINATHPNGEFTFPDGVIVQMPGDAYPEIAEILTVNGAPPVWNAQGQLALDPTIDNVITWSEVSIPDFATQGRQEVEIESYIDYAFDGIEVERGLMTDWDTPVTSLEIPKSALTPTFTYMGTISFARLSDMSEPAPDVFAIGAYEGMNIFMIVALKPQTLDFASPPPQTYPSEPFTLAGVASSGLPVAYEVVSGPAVVEGATITLVGTGTVTIRASQDGNGVYASAEDVTRTFEVTDAGGGTALADFRTVNGLAADGSEDLLTPADDGVPNLLKFAFNMIGDGEGQAPALDVPNVSTLGQAGIAGLPRLDESEGRLVLTYIRRKAGANPGIGYAVEFSGALGPASWEVNPAASESATSIDATFERVTVTDSGVFPKRFARLRVRCD